MTSGPTSDTHLGNTLHNNPDAYWCADCWKWRLDCKHLVEPLSTRHVLLNDWLLVYATYDRKTRVLEVCFSHCVRHQYRDVPLTTALALVRAPNPGQYWKGNIERQYQQPAQVRGRYCPEDARSVLMEMAHAIEGLELI